MNTVTHDIQIFSNTWTIIYNTGFTESEDISPFVGHSAIQNESNGLRETFKVVSYHFGSSFGGYAVEIHKDLYDIDKKRYLEKGKFVTMFNVDANLLKQLSNLQISNNAEFEENAKMFSRITSEIAAGDTIKHDIIPFDQNIDMTPIQPLIFTLATTSDSVTVTVENAADSNNVQTSIDGGETWSSDLVYSSLSSGEYTMLVKERESIVLSQDFTIE